MLLSIRRGVVLCLFAMLGATAGADTPTTKPADDVLKPATCGKIARVHRLADVYLAGQPTAEDLAEAKKLGIKTVLNLRPDAELKGFDERSAVEAAGLAYVHIPFSGADDLNDEIFDKAREQLKTVERPLLFHCASANRVGALWLPYRALDNGITYDAALAEAKQVGLRAPGMETKAKDYIERHKK
jgi:uncharacterized protein (TIGR01244 family)